MAMPTMGINGAMAAYNRAAQPLKQGMEARDVGGKNDFADLVKNALQEARRIGEHSEQMSIQGIRDKADLNQVITAVAEAEVTLQTVVSIRDKVIDAYKEILRMPI